MIERTVALIKPDAIRRHLAGLILTRIERENFDIRSMIWTRFSGDAAAEFYAEHEGRPYFQPLVTFIASGPVIALTLQGADAIGHWRRVMGPANPDERRAPQIRSEFCFSVAAISTMENLVHGSDSAEAYERESRIVRMLGSSNC